MAKLAASVATCILAALPLAGCSDDGTSGSDEPTPTAPTSPTTPTATTPTPTAQAWQDKYTAEQLDAYDAALERWQEYTEKINAIYKAGKDTPQARAVFREYSMQWQGRVGELVTRYDQGGARVVRPPMPTSWKAVSISPTVVIISQCTDYSDLLVTVNGKELVGTKPDHLVTPLVIEMDKPEGHDWMVATTKLKDKKPCAG